MESTFEVHLIKTLQVIHEVPANGQIIFWTWIFSAKRELKSYLEQDNSFDIMISVSHPFSSHIIANFIKKNNPHLRWIIDMGDPFCFLTDAQPNNFKIYSKLNKKVERTILNNSCAACVIYKMKQKKNI